MNCITLASKLNAAVTKEYLVAIDRVKLIDQTPERCAELHADIYKKQKAALVELFKTALELSDLFKATKDEMQGVTAAPMTFITIRPGPTTTWVDFKTTCDKYLSRKMFVSGTYSYEQKGESDDALGHGFHVHIVAKCTANKAQVLTNTINTFKHMCAANCIKVLPTLNGDKLIQDYLVDYISDDNHKTATKPWDLLWRTSLGLEPTYSL